MVLGANLNRPYTVYAGLGIPVDSAVAVRTLKTEMLVPVKHQLAPMGEKRFLGPPFDGGYALKNYTPI